MPELDDEARRRAAATKRIRTREAFVGAATDLFAEYDYSNIKIDDIAQRSRRSIATLYNYFPTRTKSSWAAAVLDARLNQALDQPAAPENQMARTPRSLLLGHFGLLDTVSAPLPGITQALIEERTAGEPYTNLLPRYYGEVTQALRDGQNQQVFRGDIDAAELADLTLDSLASVYAIHLDERIARATNMVFLLLDGLAVGE